MVFEVPQPSAPVRHHAQIWTSKKQKVLAHCVNLMGNGPIGISKTIVFKKFREGPLKLVLCAQLSEILYISNLVIVINDKVVTSI